MLLIIVVIFRAYVTQYWLNNRIHKTHHLITDWTVMIQGLSHNHTEKEKKKKGKGTSEILNDKRSNPTNSLVEFIKKSNPHKDKDDLAIKQGIDGIHNDIEEEVRRYIHKKTKNNINDADIRTINVASYGCRISNKMYEIEVENNIFKLLINLLRYIEEENMQENWSIRPDVLNEMQAYTKSTLYMKKLKDSYKEKYCNNHQKKSNIVAFVTFRYLKDVREFLKATEQNRLIKFITSAMRSMGIVCFRKYDVREALDPQEVFWDNIGSTACQRFVRHLISIVLYLLMLASSFTLQLTINYYKIGILQNIIKQNGGYFYYYLVNFSCSLLVLSINKIVGLLIWY